MVRIDTPDKVKYVRLNLVVKRVDKNGTEVTKYTPTVIKVTPTSTDATSNGVRWPARDSNHRG